MQDTATAKITAAEDTPLYLREEHATRSLQTTEPNGIICLLPITMIM